MLRHLRLLAVLSTQLFRSRRDLILANLALRQQLGVLKRRRPDAALCYGRPIVLGGVAANLAWMEEGVDPRSTGYRGALAPLWVQAVLDLALPASSGLAPGRKCVGRELRELSFRLVAENPTWGTPRIHAELKMLGFNISERSGLALDAESTEESRTGKAVGGFSD